MNPYDIKNESGGIMSDSHFSRRDFLKAAALSAGAAAFPWACRSPGASHSRRPNLLIVFPDQMRAHAQGYMGEDPVLTPRLDRLSKESLVLTHAVSNYPVCSPFRAMLMTGKYPHSNGVLANCNSNGAEYGYELKTDETCWSDILKEYGYSLGYIGKWHLDAPRKPYVISSNKSENFAWNEWCPPKRRHGFDFWYAYGTYDQHMRPMYWKTTAGRDEAEYIDQWGPEHEADQAIAYLKNQNHGFRDPDKPFALVVAMNPPHTPYHLVPDKYSSLYKDREVEDFCNRANIPPADEKWGEHYRKHIRNYLACVTGVDAQFGRILDCLQQEGLEDNTIVLFTSDHGNCIGIHNQVTKNNHYEESMRIPFLFRWPGRIKPRRDDLLVSVPDIFPTLLDLMGIGDAVPPSVEGISHAPLFLSGEGFRPQSQLYLWVPYGKPEWGRRGIRTHRYTLMVSHMPEEPEDVVLHDNIEDPYQIENIASSQTEVVKGLIDRELKPWLEKTRDPFKISV